MPSLTNKITLLCASLIVAVFVAIVAPVTIAQADPNVQPELTLAEQEKLVDDLFHKAEISSEAYNGIAEELEKANADVAMIQEDIDRQQKDFDVVHEIVQENIINQINDSSDLSNTTRLLSSGDPESFIENLTAQQIVNDALDRQYADYERELKLLNNSKFRQNEVLEEIKKLEASALEEKNKIDAAHQDAVKQLDALKVKEAEAAAAAQRQNAAKATKAPAVPLTYDGPASERGRAAVNFALSQVGDRYVYGGNGPDVWDCSGLTKAAWAKAGVSLPRVADAQGNVGSRVSLSELQPGDLIYYYSPVSHVAMYIGNGQIVHASNPRTGVKVAPLNSMPVAGASRPA